MSENTNFGFNAPIGETPLSSSTIEANKQRFIDLLSSVQRPGISTLISWLESSTDFFTAPASTKYHSCVEGGLCDHSLKVYEGLADRAASGKYGVIPEDRVILTALCHDICKVGFYKREMKRRPFKNPDGGKDIWKEVPVWVVDDQIPLGHGEKSCYYLQCCGVPLDVEEYAMIRYHMGPDDPGYSNSFSKAAAKWPSVVAIFHADMEAAYVLEKREPEEDPYGGL